MPLSQTAQGAGVREALATMDILRNRASNIVDRLHMIHGRISTIQLQITGDEPKVQPPIPDNPATPSIAHSTMAMCAVLSEGETVLTNIEERL